MIVTVNLNTAIDRTFFIDDFAWNKTIRASRSVLGMGGKAADASWILGELGHPNLAMGFAAGDTGKLMVRMLQARGSKTDFVWVKGETRTNIIVISEKGRGQSTLVSSGLDISDQDCKTLILKFRKAMKRARCVIIGGSVPKGIDLSISAELIRIAHSRGIPVIFDASGPTLKAGMEGRPDFVKPNLDEISQLSGIKVTDFKSAFTQAKQLQEKFGATFIITLGSRGALAVLEDRAYRIPPLKLKVISTAGAGDGVLAGLSVAVSQGKSIEDGLRLGFAAAAAVCLTPATADCHRQDVEALLPKIQLFPYPR
jgi:1-phosphofructokinase family hexose kinase